MSDETVFNRLENETSPYLLQHADNPVQWYPWGEEAFAKARTEGKPIFLSVGYSTCHWCHVMAHESFENTDVAAVLNEHFVAIKVDREERPDLDRVYMTFVQATTGQGGWPMSVWLTPDLQPFYGGTYFPPEDRWGRPGFKSILTALAKIWREDRPRVLEQGAHAVQVLRQFGGQSFAAPESAGATGSDPLSPAAIDRAFEVFRNSFDPEWGGFGGAPKFPRPAVLALLARVHAAARAHGDAARASDAAGMLLGTLRQMVAGGVHDQLGGGFHRYAVDATWHVPHFEKMLYDQAQLVCALLEGYQISGDAMLAQAARRTLDYVTRDLMSPRGGFYSAEDADSRKSQESDDHGEGAFYVWSADELREAVGPERAAVFAIHHGVFEEGNAPDGADPHGEFRGQNILLGRRTLADTARETGLPPDRVESILAACEAILFQRREKRPRPHRDQKILAAWNGQMISAFARAAQVLDEPAYAATASRAAEYILHVVWDGIAGVLHRGWCAGRKAGLAFAEDHACLVQGFLDLYEATFEIRWLKWAVDMQDGMDQLFWDASAGGYFSSSDRDPSVLVRMKEDHDGAEPSPSSLAVLNLIRLGRMLGDEARLGRAEATMRAFAGTWERAPQALPLMLAGLVDWLQPHRQVVLAGDREGAEVAALAREVRRRHLPGLVVLAADGGEGQKWLGRRQAALKAMAPVDGRAAAYVCRDFACQLPVTEPAALGTLLDGQGAG
ncbi:MAG: thioredoxin domain-containing protein [Opitutaceae bacterium]|nr:thioredoxin domain-containing protein [Opitutaceae bacterium]